MFTPKLNVSRGRFSGYNTPNKSGTPTGLNRRTSSLYAPNRRSPYTPGRNQSLNASSLQTSQFLDDTTQHKLDRFGGSLPITVTETLTLRKRNEEASIKLDSSGWAWLVCGRKLILWKYKTTQIGKTSHCHELTLPPSELEHNADMVTVLPGTGELTSACVAMSGEGVVRYWSNFAHPGSFVEVSTDVKGQVFSKIIFLEQSYSCIMATTTSSMVHLTLVQGQNSAKCRFLRPPQGMLSGIGRRMSSLIFGGVTSQAIEAPLHQILPGEILEGDKQAVYVLAGPNLQKWAIFGDSEKLVYQCNVDSLVRDGLADSVWGQSAGSLASLKTWLVDMQLVRDGIVVFGAGVNSDVSQQLHYALGTLHTEGMDPPLSFLSFSIPKYSVPYRAEDEKELLSSHLILPDISQSSVYLFDSKSVLCMSVNSSSLPVDKVEFHSTGDKLLGAGNCDGLALFFSNAQGILSIKETSQDDASASESMMIDTLSRLDTSIAAANTPGKLEELSMSDDKTCKLKAAFLHACRGNMPQAQSLVDDMFPPGLPLSDEPGASLDRLVVLLSQEMVDDYPASDPRWAESVPNDFASSSASLILVHQLEDKLKAHECLVQFLKNVGLWDRLSSMYVRDGTMQTRMILCEHAEKVVAAKSLHGHHTQNPHIVDEGIKRVLKHRGVAEPQQTTGLTAQDLFYREVSRIQEFLECLLDYEEELLNGEIAPREVVQISTTINTIFAGVLFDACNYRQSKTMSFHSPASPRDPEYLPWTATMGPKGVRALLIRQHHLTFERALMEAGDNQQRGALYQQLMELTDLVLDGYKTQLESIKQTVGETPHFLEVLRKYEQDRSGLIMPLMNQQQYERAASLAEKYCDFAILVKLCEETDNQDRLNRYMNQFQNRGFSDFAFKWYVEEGKRGKLMTSQLSAHPHLSRFLSSGDNKFMSWLHDISANNYLQAHKTLFDLGVEEERLITKKKTLLSLSKLAAIATEDAPDWVHNNLEAINTEQDLVEQQDQLPLEVLESLGIDPEKMRVLSPKELVELYVGDANANANEFDFKKALDLLQYIDKNDPEIEYQKLLLLIWSKAILRDSLSTEDPIESVKETVFFKTVELAVSEGMDLTSCLPNADHLLSAEYLTSLKDNKNFQYLLRVGYEQIQRILA